MSTRKIVFTAFEIIFVAIIPTALVIVNYSSWGAAATHFKIAFSGIILLFLVAYFIKKIILIKWLERARATLTQHKADLKVETQGEKHDKLVEAVKRGQILETLLTYIFPFLVLAGLYVLAGAVESAAVQLSGTIGLISASLVIGFIFGMLAAREVK